MASFLYIEDNIWETLSGREGPLEGKIMVNHF